MLLGIGVDIVHLPRIAKILTRRQNNCHLLCRRILSSKEQAEFQARFPKAAVNQKEADPDVVRFLASRWSIKEAMYKAMYPERKLTWKEVTIDRIAGDKPRAILAGQDPSIHTHISVSHDGEYAIAYAVIEKL
ncbi:4'-phosphopantetheinyl transferase superfamily [Umbelopsis sp. AD052]|nr:4'-phosphopantetheinyl transferase superfamily [Umbelopsis sp. AD052]